MEINDFLVDNESRLIGRSEPHVEIVKCEIVVQEWNPVFNAAAIHEEIQREPGMEPLLLLSLSWTAQLVKFVISQGKLDI